MKVEKVATIVPVDDLAPAVASWTELLGVEPTFVDGDRWAQFDVAATRIALAGTDRMSDEVSIMLKVSDIEEAHAASERTGHSVGEIEKGPHERRFEVTGDELPPIIFYAPVD
ncbi:MAG: bleomycin resistance protein [Actinobacteria bacterium]|nr:bleomycin resistance protein [Actinomycetota bacterium]